MISSFAPVTIPAYRRLGHLMRTIEALRNNPLAEQTELFITSDGPRPGDEQHVSDVRAFLKTVRGFKHVEIVERDENNRLENWNFRRQLAQTYGRLIVVEDDCLTTPGFLGYMNACLDRFSDDQDIFGVAGFCPPLPGVQSSPFRLFQLQRFSAWGFGIYGRSDSLVRQNLSLDEFNRLASSREFLSELMNRTGLGLLGMLRKCATGELLAYDIMANLEMIQRKMRMIFPSGSLVRNIGHDGSGLHCGISNRFDTDTIEEPSIDWTEAPIDRNTAIERKMARFYGSSTKAWLRFQSKRLRGRIRIRQSEPHVTHGK
jgi:hypothetical protein